MGRKGIKIPREEKLKYAKLCYEGKLSYAEAGRQLGVKRYHVTEWTHLYEDQGELAFLDTGSNAVYSNELKL